MARMAMSDHLAAFEGANLGLAAAIVLTALLAGVVAVGPVRGQLARASAELHDTAHQLALWQAEYARFQPVPAEQRARWRARWLSFAGRLRPATSDADLMALVAEGLQAPSVRGLQVSRRQTSVTASDTEDEEMLVFPIGEGDPVLARTESLQATLAASYEDALRILERLEARELPARLEVIELRRDFPDVTVHLELAYFVRPETEQ
jgi:hypothetical protein